MENQKPKIIALLILGVFLLAACAPAPQFTTSQELRVETQAAFEEPAETETAIEEPIDPEEDIEGSLGAETSTGEPSDTDLTEIAEEPLQSDLETSSSNNGLTEDEIAGLVFMREEEKLAHDVYLGLYDLWGLSIFQNIADSEQTHTDAVKRLLDTYNIPDPADTSPIGTFVDNDLQEMYDELMAIGAQSLGDALKVGAAVEEIDILDLQAYLEKTQNDAIRGVYENLLRGSENHLRAFTNTLERQTGEVYQPQYLLQEDYEGIVSSGPTRGRRGKGNRP